MERNQTLTRPFMSEEIVLYRTASGEARAVAPYCPHLGAHLGRSGNVEGETLRCAFHGFCFDGAGACVATGYGTKPPPLARLAVRHVREQHGVIMVWHDPSGKPPAWEVPMLDTEGWSPFVLERLSLRGHPQETTENSVDFGHFAIVHGYRNVRVIREARIEGPYLTARYAMTRGLGPFGRIGVALDTEFELHVHGLGYSLVEVDIKSLGLRTRHLVMSTPTEEGRIALTLGVSMKEPRTLDALGKVRDHLPLRRLTYGMASIAFPIFRHDVMQDFDIWENKRYVARPALAQGDGPVGLYRKWVTQFYPT
ncbi:Phenylpropionate dioxygenase [Minicystis rosea]|nr:Phenylpropionate dioxygenase [Minicystis rosea]